MKLRGQKVVVMGLAGSGLAAARLLSKLGARVVCTDAKPAAELDQSIGALEGLGIEFALGGHPEDILDGAALLVPSPGVPKNAPLIMRAQDRGVPVWSEIELASRHVSAKIIAVTGSNGKTTAVSLLGDIMRRAFGDGRVFVGGNIGTPLSELPLSGREVEVAVVEVSSFQLEFVHAFRPRVAAVLNITPDHQDRYRDFKEYGDYKWRVFENMDQNDVAVLDGSDAEIAARLPGLRPRPWFFGLEESRTPGMRLEGGSIALRTDDSAEYAMPADEVPLHGTHNLKNAMACALAALAMNVGWETARAAIKDFKGLAHRLEFARELDGVRYFDDSKATNPGAVLAAVLGLDSPAILLMGGQAKGCSFNDLAKKIAGRTRLVAAFGECREQLREEMGADHEVAVTETMGEALALARQKARPGDAVLLSPGCASFDQFDGYKHRGDVFKRLVEEL